MPKLLMFVPCDRVIVDNEGVISLISLIEKVQLAIPANIEIPDKATLPHRWTIVSIWRRDPDDIQQAYEQQVEIFGEDGRALIVTSGVTAVEFSMPLHRSFFHLTQMPMTEGNLVLAISLRKTGEEWQRIAEFPLDVDLLRPN